MTTTEMIYEIAKVYTLDNDKIICAFCQFADSHTLADTRVEFMRLVSAVSA